ncbi:MAG: AraC family transcriptional regulator [Oscillospiraceae bacterium]
MSFDIKKYCFCGYPMDENGEKTVEYNHEGINVFLVSSARCIAHSQGKSITVNTGEILYTTGETTLDIVNNGHIIGLNIEGIISEKFCREASGAFVTSGIFAPFLPQQIMQVVMNYTSLAPSYLSNTAFEIINTLSSSDKKSVMASQVVTDAVMLIKENYASVYGVEELAQSLKVSKSHLVREFYKYTGITPGKYLTNVRVDAVKQLLVQESLSLNTVAALTGFSGDNYLCKAFKKATGETPMSYKMRILNSQYLPNQTTIQVEPEIYL